MFEGYTFEYLMESMLSRVPDSLDKREGSIIYDALAPAAAELAQMYIRLDATRDLTFISTSSGRYLDELVGEFGLTRIPSSKAVVKGVFNSDIPLGSRFSGEALNYIATEKVSEGVFLLECETSGTEGNGYTGRIVPIEYIDGLQSAEITEIVIPARDEETDEELKKRFYENITGGAQDGNVAQYKKWITEYNKIGIGKVFSLWNGANTVKVSILDNEYKPATEELITEFQNYLDPESKGLGNGAAPIGAVVTVSTAAERGINISADVYLNNGYESAEDVQMALESLFKDLAYTSNVVNFYEVAVKISSCESVMRISNLKINNGSDDIVLNDEEIPVLGTLSIQVVKE